MKSSTLLCFFLLASACIFATTAQKKVNGVDVQKTEEQPDERMEEADDHDEEAINDEEEVYNEMESDIEKIEEDEKDKLALLGKSMYVPKEDLLGSLPNGITFYKDIPDSCFRKVNLAITVKDESFYKNTAKFYRSVATQTGLKASANKGVYSLVHTLDVTTKHVSGLQRTVSGTSLKMATKDHELQFTPRCLYDTALDHRMVGDFAKLKTKIDKPWLRDSWRDYQVFLEQHGSHVITGVTYGSSITEYAFANQKESYKKRDFQIKACLSLAGRVKLNKLGLQICSSVTKEEKNSVKNLEIVTSTRVRGGTPDTRNQILHDRSNELIRKFLNEGTTSPTPIEFELTPIWEILARHRKELTKNPHVKTQALNLQYYYEGYLNFGCRYIEGSRGPALQQFELVSNRRSRPMYQCSIAPSGCHHDDDCHYNVGAWCSCRGESCIRHSETTAPTGMEKMTAKPFLGSGWGWQGCNWKVWGSVCGCKDERTTRKVIWPKNS